MIYRDKDKFNHKAGFTISSNEYAANKNLSFTAKGIMAYLLTLPDDTDIALDDIIKHCKMNRIQFDKAIKELMKEGYLQVKLVYEASNDFRVSKYDLYETQNILPLKSEPQKTLSKNVDSNTEAYILANKLFEKTECLLSNTPDLNKWANEFKKFMKLSGNRFDRIAQMIDYFQSDNWFKYHVLSANTFCRLWDRIWNRYCFDQDRKKIVNKTNEAYDTLNEMIDDCNENNR